MYEVISRSMNDGVTATGTASVPTRAKSMLAGMLKCKVGERAQCNFIPVADCPPSVLLQAMKEDPPPDARCRDKFLVQTVALSRDSDTTNIPAVVSSTLMVQAPVLTKRQWQNIEKANKSSIQECKIRVAFLPADGNASTPSHQNVYGTVSRKILSHSFPAL